MSGPAPPGADPVPAPSDPPTGPPAAGPDRSFRGNARALVRSIREGDEAQVEAAVFGFSRRRRILAPLALVVGAFSMLFQGLKLLVTNWRLTLVQVLPAMWIWAAMLDLKVHVLRGKEFVVIRGPILIPISAAIVAVTMASFYLNAVFAFAVVAPRAPDIPAGFAGARVHRRQVFAWGAGVGVLLVFGAVIVDRWGKGWFALVMGSVVALMMFAYVAVPSRLVGARASLSRRDSVSATILGGVAGAVICVPPYTLGRIGILMLGSRVLFVPGIFVLALGVTLQAGATGSVKAIKMSAKLLASSDRGAAGSEHRAA